MAEFSPSLLGGLPPTTSSSLEHGDPRTIGWILEMIQEGDRIYESDPSYRAAELGMEYVAGRHRRHPEDDLPYLPRVVINESRKAVQAHSSTLTDLKPVIGYRSTDPFFEQTAFLLNRRTVAWWISTSADRPLSDAIKFALGAGTADIAVEWNPYAPLGGDNLLVARDFRDTLPIFPGQSSSPQTWGGVVFREEHPQRALLDHYGVSMSPLLVPSADSLLSSIRGRLTRLATRILSPAGDTLAGLSSTPRTSLRAHGGPVVLFRCFLDDRTRNLTANTLAMGNPTTGWAYRVPPGGFLYPWKRLIICTEKGLLYDGPSTFLHGLYPFSRLRLWSVPWQLLGIPLLSDIIPLQDAINDTVQDLRIGIRRWIRPSTAYNRGTVSEAFMRRYDPRRSGQRIKLTDAAALSPETGFRQLEGPNPQVLGLSLQALQLFLEKHADLSGTAKLQELLSLRQLPSADTIQRYYEAMTPELREEGREIEVFLRDIAEMLKVNWFQYEDRPKRLSLLGEQQGQVLDDFDDQPDDLVPAMAPTMPGMDPETSLPGLIKTPGYRPELDAHRPRADRVRAFHKLFAFVMEPNSLLAMNAQEKKMEAMQGARMGYIDFWTYHEVMGTPNVGLPPAIPLPPLRTPTRDQLMADSYKYILGQNGELLEIRIPMTVTERLIAQNMIGIGMTQNAAGRKAAGEDSPKMEEKDGGTRTTVTESRQS